MTILGLFGFICLKVSMMFLKMLLFFIIFRKNQFDVSVKTFISDKVTKFINKKLSNFTEKYAIVHQTSCSYNPQQNGVVKRKHKHLFICDKISYVSGANTSICGLNLF